MVRQVRVKSAAGLPTCALDPSSQVFQLPSDSTLLTPPQVMPLDAPAPNCSARSRAGHLVAANTFALLLSIPLGDLAYGQKLPDVTPAPKGQTINMTLQTGSKSNLSFGTNTSFGASLSSQFSPGMTVTATSSFTPSEASITSTIGAGATPGKTTATISNLRAQGTGSTTVAGAPINATDANFASGNAVLDGVGASVNIVLDPLKSGFNVEALPNIVGSSGCSPSKSSTACKYTKDDGTKPYSDQQFANGSATANINTNTTVDINTSQFASSFSQSF